MFRTNLIHAKFHLLMWKIREDRWGTHPSRNSTVFVLGDAGNFLFLCSSQILVSISLLGSKELFVATTHVLGIYFLSFLWLIVLFLFIQHVCLYFLYVKTLAKKKKETNQYSGRITIEQAIAPVYKGRVNKSSFQ